MRYIRENLGYRLSSPELNINRIRLTMGFLIRDEWIYVSSTLLGEALGKPIDTGINYGK